MGCSTNNTVTNIHVNRCQPQCCPKPSCPPPACPPPQPQCCTPACPPQCNHQHVNVNNIYQSQPQCCPQPTCQPQPQYCCQKQCCAPTMQRPVTNYLPQNQGGLSAPRNCGCGCQNNNIGYQSQAMNNSCMPQTMSYGNTGMNSCRNCQCNGLSNSPQYMNYGRPSCGGGGYKGCQCSNKPGCRGRRRLRNFLNRCAIKNRGCNKGCGRCGGGRPRYGLGRPDFSPGRIQNLLNILENKYNINIR